MRRIPRTTSLLVAPVLLAGFAAGCGDNKGVAESKITKALSAQGVKATKTTCPHNIKTDKGKSFTCSVIVSGKKVNATFKFVDDKGNFALTGATPAG